VRQGWQKKKEERLRWFRGQPTTLREKKRNRNLLSRLGHIAESCRALKSEGARIDWLGRYMKKKRREAKRRKTQNKKKKRKRVIRDFLKAKRKSLQESKRLGTRVGSSERGAKGGPSCSKPSWDRRKKRKAKGPV